MSYLESLRVFARVTELGSITAGGRDLRLTPAVASKRIKELEQHLGVRLFNRTTRSLSPTEVGRRFYSEVVGILESLDRAEAVVAQLSAAPRGVIRVSAPLGVGRRVIAPLIPDFVEKYTETEVRMRMSDRKVDLLADSLDIMFFVGTPSDSSLKMRQIAVCERVLCASPDYLERAGTPRSPEELMTRHNCLLLRYPRSPEYYWTLNTPEGPRRLDVTGKYDADDSDVLADWALAGHGIVNKPYFDVAEYIREGRLVEVLPHARPAPSVFGCLYPHKKLQDPKVRLLLDFIADRGLTAIRNLVGQR
ncbi:LysR family transcriptional regulator [Paracoccus aerodenitrificans]|uniref:LysR family transcriptional regulator n=1 Tax=Paracoccus aerodenitrificans TaxID=3017781 RepID=UPI0022F11B19|nr:LysR family transcriptional regulator [Paracoccus aerodenitrificans]WBU65636.1 LysR family transcriptional regulator [Paracoccus aerodenitrificans]